MKTANSLLQCTSILIRRNKYLKQVTPIQLMRSGINWSLSCEWVTFQGCGSLIMSLPKQFLQRNWNFNKRIHTKEFLQRQSAIANMTLDYILSRVLVSKQGLTLPLSISLVVMTMTLVFSCQIIFQKSSTVAGRQPWVAMYLLSDPGTSPLM